MRDYGASGDSGHTIQLGPPSNYTSSCHRSSVTVQRMHMCWMCTSLYTLEHGSRSTGWHSNVEMRVDTLIWDVLDPPHEILERPFRPLEPLNLWIYEDPGALYPFNPWTLEP